jgi:cellulose biosynthesis protein BcsQ
MVTYAFWNNKGGTGKTSLNFQTILSYAKLHKTKKILAMDLCPQANLSELMLGGLVKNGGQNLLSIQTQNIRKTVGGYFQFRLPQPYTAPHHFDPLDYIISPHTYNEHILKNIDLLSGDPLLELQSNSISTLANNQIPGQNPWLSIIDWLKDFITALNNKYDTIFIDCNPSFSIYTQIALSITDKLIIPVMSDDSSRRALQNAFSLIYGFQLPSPIYSQYSFSTKLKSAGRDLPKVHLIVKNRLTQYMGPASAYNAVLQTVDQQISKIIASNPEIFTTPLVNKCTINIRDFGTTGVVSFAEGKPFFNLESGKHKISNKIVTVRDDYTQNAIEAINNLVNKL